MSDASDSAPSPKLAGGAPEAKRRHHAPVPSPTKAGAADTAGTAAPLPPLKPEAAPRREVTAADPVAEQHVRGALHSVCRSVDRYTKITQIGKGTYGFVFSSCFHCPFPGTLLVTTTTVLFFFFFFLGWEWGHNRRVYKASYDHSDGRREYVALKKVRMEDEKEGVCKACFHTHKLHSAQVRTHRMHTRTHSFPSLHCARS